jgi:hypothetical protein
MITLIVVLVALPAYAQRVNTAAWQTHFAYTCDYELIETEGLARTDEPVEVTISDSGDTEPDWEYVRVLRMSGDAHGELVPHQMWSARRVPNADPNDPQSPASAASANLLFLADCPANGSVTYRLFWGRPDSIPPETLPAAEPTHKLRVSGEAPNLSIESGFYRVQLEPKSGAIKTASAAGDAKADRLAYKTVPIHFAADVWSAPKRWDHIHDWNSVPNQKLERGPLALRYHCWGPLQYYTDVNVSVTYTFYAARPAIEVSTTMEFTADRSARMVRMGEIVVAHSRADGVRPDEPQMPNLFTHYAWPELDGAIQRYEIDANRDDQGRAVSDTMTPGAMAILDRDVPWVAGYNAELNYGVASLRRQQFVGNRRGGPIPHAAPNTYLANYGWGFTYWSRPMVSPLGEKAGPLDRNSVVADGTLFATEEALLFFESDDLRVVADAQRAYKRPLKLVFKGTGPW